MSVISLMYVLHSHKIMRVVKKAVVIAY